MTMRTLKDSKGKVIGVSMNDEPKFRRLKVPEIITTRNTPANTPARLKSEAEAEAAKIEADKKAAQNAKA
jgi:hypothetical protein